MFNICVYSVFKFIQFCSSLTSLVSWKINVFLLFATNCRSTFFFGYLFPSDFVVILRVSSPLNLFFFLSENVFVFLKHCLENMLFDFYSEQEWDAELITRGPCYVTKHADGHSNLAKTFIPLCYCSKLVFVHLSIRFRCSFVTAKLTKF